MIDHHTNPYRPRHFRVVIDHHRLEVDNYGRKRDVTEWAHEVLKTLAHELVHVRQFAERGYLRFSFDYLRHYAAGLLRHRRSRQVYLDIPAEVEARADAADWRARTTTPR